MMVISSDAKTPAEFRDQMVDELARQIAVRQSTQAGVRTKRESAQIGGEISALQGLQAFLGPVQFKEG